MAIITNYATLQTAVSDYLARSDLTDWLPNFIENAERKLYRTLNLRNEETALSVAVSSGVAAVPSTFKKLKYAYYNGTPVSLLQWVPVEELYRDYPDRSETTSKPSVISREAGNFIFGPVAADGAGQLRGVYYAKLSLLSASNTTNWYTSNAPEVLLYGALLEASPFIHDDPRIPVWQQFYNDAVMSLKIENDNAETSAGQLIQRVS